MAKLQDILSGLKSFAKSDTGKALGMTLGTIAAGRYGGTEGINALTSAIEKTKERRKLAELEKEKKDIERKRQTEREEDRQYMRDLNKLKSLKAELDIDMSREKLLSEKNKNYADLQNKIMNYAGVPISTGSKGSNKSGLLLDSEKPPKPLPPPAPTPVSIDNPKEVQKGELDAARWAAKYMANMGLIGVGKKVWDENKHLLNQELSNTGLTKEQQSAAWKEMSRLAMPGRYEQIPEEMAEAANPNYTWGEKAARLQESGLNAAGTIGGAALGATIGTSIVPGAGTVAGGLLGGALGYAGAKPVGSKIFSGQSDASSTPSVAGSGKNASEDMASYSDDNIYAMQIASGLQKFGVTVNDVPTIMAQLDQIPEISDNKERRDKILKLVKEYLLQPAKLTAQL